MNFFWVSVALTLVVLAALLPDDAAIALDILDLWIRTAWIWLRGLQLRVILWLRLQWDGSWIAWRLWVIRQHNRNNKAKDNV